MYAKKIISVTSHALDHPSPVTNCHTFSDPSPFVRDVLYGRHPKSCFARSHASVSHLYGSHAIVNHI